MIPIARDCLGLRDTIPCTSSVFIEERIEEMLWP